MSRAHRGRLRPSAAGALACLLLAHCALNEAAHAYVFNYTIAAAGGCPQPHRFDTVTSGKLINRRWSTSLGVAPLTILTGDQTALGRLNEIEESITASYSAWANVAGTSLVPAKFNALQRTTTQNACTNDAGTNFDGLNTVCLNQSSNLFAASLGVLAFTRVVSSDILGETLGASGPSVFIGEILDADVLFRPGEASVTFATPSALPSNPNAFDFESVLTHELGHLFGFSHSAVWRAMMFPFAPARGTFLGDRPSPGALDAPLAEDDRAGLRVLYPGATSFGTISGRILPANPFSLATIPEPSPGAPVTGIFGAHVVALDADTGEVVAAALGGWSCDPANLPTRFDGFYAIGGLLLGRNYKVYAEPLDAPVSAGDMASATSMLCRAPGNACHVPQVNANFPTRVRPP